MLLSLFCYKVSVKFSEFLSHLYTETSKRNTYFLSHVNVFNLNKIFLNNKFNFSRKAVKGFRNSLADLLLIIYNGNIIGNNEGRKKH